MMLEHGGKRPRVHEPAYVAPNATLCGDVIVGENSRVLFGVVIAAEGGPVEVGSNCIVMETLFFEARRGIRPVSGTTSW